MKPADSSAIPSLSEVPVAACSAARSQPCCSAARSSTERKWGFHVAAAYRWRACGPLCYSTSYKWFIESEILASLYLSAGGWRTQLSLCAHCIAISPRGAPAVFLHKYVSIMSLRVSCMTWLKSPFFIISHLYCWYSVISRLVRLSRHMFCV